MKSRQIKKNHKKWVLKARIAFYKGCASFIPLKYLVDKKTQKLIKKYTQ